MDRTFANADAGAVSGRTATAEEFRRALDEHSDRIAVWAGLARAVNEREARLRKAQGLGDRFDGLFARLDGIGDAAEKSVGEAVDRFQASVSAGTTDVVGKIDAARMKFEEKMARMSNGGPPLDSSKDGEKQSEISGNGA